MSITWVIPNEGKQLILDECFRLTTTRESFILYGFKSNTTVGNASTFADFTISDFTGYSNVNIARGDWTAATVVSNQGKIVKTTAPTFTCTAGGGQLMYGVLLVGATSGKIYAGGNFSTARNMSAGSVEAIDPCQIFDDTLT